MIVENNLRNGIIECNFDVEFPNEVVKYTFWRVGCMDMNKYYDMGCKFEYDLIINLLRTPNK